MKCYCGSEMDFLVRWEISQVGFDSYNLFNCFSCGRILKDNYYYKIWISLDDKMDKEKK